MNRLIRERLREDAGMSLAEMLVGIFIFAILTTLAFVTVMSGSSNLKAVRQTNDLNEEARLVLNRMSRELREASGIAAVQNPDATNADGSERVCSSYPSPCFDPNADVSVTFEVDFNGDGCIDQSGTGCLPNADEERLTYHYERANRRLLLKTASQTTPILAGNVSSFKLSYRSNDYRCDVNSNGEVTWQELETAASPPCPSAAGSLAGGSSALDTELPYINQVILEITVLTPPRDQQYRTKIDLRNRR